MFNLTVNSLGSGVFYGLFPLGGFTPLVLAAADSDNVPIPVWAASILLGGILALIGWMLQRAVSKLDQQLISMDDRIAAQDRDHAAAMGNLDKAHQDLRERLVRVEERCGLVHGTKTP